MMAKVVLGVGLIVVSLMWLAEKAGLANGEAILLALWSALGVLMVVKGIHA